MYKWHTFYDRSTLKREIDYITRPGVEYVDVRNLSKYRGDYAEQFNETFRLYGKRTDKDKPQYYGIIVSYDPRDNPSPKDAQESCVRLMETTFPNFECVIATHTDTGTVHTHILMNSVNLVTGFKLEFNKVDRKKMKEDHIKIGESYGYIHTRVMERNPDYITTAEERIRARGGWSWKDDIRNFVRGAVENVRVATPEDFMAYLSDYNMEVLDTGKEFLYFHPKEAQGVRGKKLGPYYTRKSVMAAIEKNREETERREAERREAERLEVERLEAEKTPSISRLDEYNQIEVWVKFGKRVAEMGLLYNDFKEFVEEVEKYEKEGTLASFVRGWVEDALKDPLTAKDYGELTWEEFYREKRYALFCQECKRDNVVPVSRDIFYLDNGWTGPENLSGQEVTGQTAENAVSIDMLDDYTKVEVWFRCAENVVKAGRSWHDFNELVKYIKNAERRCCLEPSLFGYIEVGFRNPLTEEDYGELTPEEFYHEKRYTLSIEESLRDNKNPLSREDFYRDNGWTIPESLASRETESQEVTSQEVTSQEVTSQEVTSQEVTNQEVVSQEVASQEVASQEVVSQEVEMGEIPQTSSINQLDVYNKIAVWFSYAEREIKEGNRYYDFNDFVEKVEEIEKRGNRVTYVSDCIDDAIKNPLTEKDYGELSSVEFYREKVYALCCEEYQRDGKTPLSRDDFYRDNGWTVPEKPVNQEVENQEVENQEVENQEVENQEVENQEVEDQEDDSWEVEASEDGSRKAVNQESEKPISISQLDDYSKVSAWFEYAKSQAEWGLLYHDFLVFEAYIKIHEESGTFAIGQEYVEEAFRHPTTEKEYGKLNSWEFYQEKCYELFLVKCAKDKKSPLSREDFYRENGWMVPKCLAEQSEAAADGGSAKPADGTSRSEWSSGQDAVSIDRLDDRTRLAVWFRYAEGEVKEKRSYLQYQDFVEKVREDEKAGKVEELLRGYIKDGFKNSSIEKGYEGLNSIELYYELNYVLYVDTCVRDGKIPCDREKYYLNYRYGLTERLKNRPDGVAVATIGKMPYADGASARGIGSSGRDEPRADGASENSASPKQSTVGIDQLGDYTKVAVWARYSEDLINAGEQMYNFGNFVDWVKDAESKGSLPPDLKGYIEDGIKNPVTEKDYGKLSSEEFRREKDYALECLFRRLHYRSSVSREEYYRQKGWAVPDSLKKRRDDYMGK